MLTGKQLEAVINKCDRTLAGLEDSAIARINDALTAAYKALERELLKQYATQSANKSLLPGQRKLLLMQEINQLLQLINSRNAPAIEKAFTDLLRGSYGEGQRLSDQLVRAIANQQLQSFAAVPTLVLVAQAKDGMSRLRRHGDAFASKASAIVEMGLATGWGPQKVARQLRIALGVTKGQAEAIAQTEANSAFNTAAVESYHRLDIEGTQIVATADDRVCPSCTARNGNVYAIGKIKVPLHVRCRCYLIPWKKSWNELGLTNDDWHREFKQKTLAELAAQGKQPDYGVAPFEKAAGLTKAPEPIWTP